MSKYSFVERLYFGSARSSGYMKVMHLLALSLIHI